MKVFQIFDKPIPPKEPYAGYMRAIRDMADEYTLIAPNNFMGAGFVFIGAVWRSLPQYLQEHTNGPRMGFDALRAYYLSRHFDHVYLDVDVQLFRPLELLDVPQADGPGVLVGTGDPIKGLACWDMYLHLCPRFCRPASLMFAGNQVQPAPKSYFHHHYAKGEY